MSINKTTRLGLIIVLISLGLAACGGPAATPAPTATATVAATETAEPTETPYPTETVPAVPTTAGTPGATTAAGATPAATTAGAAAATPATGAATSAPAASGGSAAMDKYTYLGQSMADKTQLLPGRQVTITWSVKNSGTNGWTKDYMLRYFSGPEPSKTSYTFGKDVPAGGTINFAVTFTTPAELGDYDLWFKLTNTSMQNFGDLDFAFTVTNSPNNSQPKATSAAPAATATTAK